MGTRSRKTKSKKSSSKRLPFDDPDFIFGVKWDGFALAVIEHGSTRLISRNGHGFVSFAALEG
jgi:ATP-dependent DNA ligase